MSVNTLYKMNENGLLTYQNSYCFLLITHKAH